MTSLTLEVGKEAGVKPREAERAKNFFALGRGQLAVQPPDRGDPRLDRQALRGLALGARRQHQGVQGGLPLRRDRRAVRVGVPGASRGARAGDLHRRDRQHRSRVGSHRRVAASRAAAVPGLLPDHPGVRHPPRAVQAQALRGEDLAGRGRDRRRHRGDRRGVRRVPGSDDDERSRYRPQVGGDRARCKSRAAARGRRHPAGWSVHGPSHEDRAVGPSACDVRPPRRGARADRRRAYLVALLRGCGGGGAHSGQVPHTGLLALGRLARQRGRALEAARALGLSRRSTRDSPSRPTTRTRTAQRSSGRTSETRRRSHVRGPYPGPPGSSTASAVSRRRTGQGTSRTTSEPRADDPAAGRRKWPGSQRTSRRCGSTIPTAAVRRRCSRSVGVRPTGRSRLRCGGSALGG